MSRPGPHPLADAVLGWLERHYDEAITVADIAAGVGVSVRYLQLICNQQWNLTPTELLRGIRLDHAHRAILSAEPGESTVTAIAHHVGYRHMSRFAAHYRERFGEAPSQTLRNRTR